MHPGEARGREDVQCPLHCSGLKSINYGRHCPNQDFKRMVSAILFSPPCGICSDLADATPDDRAEVCQGMMAKTPCLTARITLQKACKTSSAYKIAEEHHLLRLQLVTE